MQTLLGCCAGCQVGKTYKDYLINEIKKQDDALQNNNIARINTNETIVDQPSKRHHQVMKVSLVLGIETIHKK